MDPTALIGTALFNLGTHLFTPKPSLSIGIPAGRPFEQALATRLDKSGPATTQKPRAPSEWPEVKNVLKLLESYDPVALEINAKGRLFVLCADDSRHLIALTPERGAELRVWAGDESLPRIIPLDAANAGNVNGARQAALQGLRQ